MIIKDIYEYIKNKNNSYCIKIISIILVIIIVILNIPNDTITTMASTSNKPNFTISNISFNPIVAKVGEEITVNGTINPIDFETSIQPKEIVLVLDISGSMNDLITVNNKRTTKIKELKNAANNFIVKMKDVQNLKIGIVTYSKNSTIQSDLISSNNTLALSDAINAISANGGTNTGEGLRKATYLLSNSNNQSNLANKIIVFMSDGIPTYNYKKWVRTGFIKGHYEYNCDITKENIENDSYLMGSGNSDYSGECLKYATTIGQIISNKGYNIFSIGYGLGVADSSGNKNMKSIHESMGGESGINGTFFPTDEGAIASVFESIADNIINSYDIKNLSFFNKMIDEFTLVAGENTISIPNINYKKVENNSDQSKIKYHAESYNFTFKIKASQAGEYSNIFKESDISFLWNNERITCEMPISSIKIISNELPVINTEMIKPEDNPYTLVGSDEKIIDMSYEINPQPFHYSIDSSQYEKIDEAIFLIDLSKEMDQNERPILIKNELTNKVIQDSRLKNIKLGVIGYKNGEVFVGDRNTFNDPKNVDMKLVTDANNLIKPIFDIDGGNEQDGFRKIFQESYLGNKISSDDNSNNNRNIDKALEVCDNIFIKNGDNKKRAIILVTAGKVNYDNSSINLIKNKGYKVISLDMSANYENKQLHLDLLGDDSDYIKAEIKDGKYSNSANMQQVADRLVGGIIDRSYKFDNVKLNFNLGENFQLIQGSQSDNIQSVELNNNKIIINLPQIRYIESGDKDQEGRFRYESIPFEISFKIRVNENKYGTLNFSNYNLNSDNNIMYTKLNKSIVRELIETPTIILSDAIDIIHGIYCGNMNGEQIVDDTNMNNSFSKESIVTMAAKFDTYRNYQMQLILDEKLSLAGRPNVYKILENGNMILLGEMDSENRYVMKENDKGNIIVIYSVKLSKEKTGLCENVIKIGDETKEAFIKIESKDLPDLF